MGTVEPDARRQDLTPFSRIYLRRRRPSGSRGVTRRVSEWPMNTRPAPPRAGRTCLRRVAWTSAFGVLPGLGEESCDLRRLAQVVGSRAPLVVTKDDVRPGHVPGVEPQVLRARHPKRQVLVLAGVASHQQRHAPPGEVVRRPGRGSSRGLARDRGLRREDLESLPVPGLEKPAFADALGREGRRRLTAAPLDLLPGPLGAPGFLEASLGVAHPVELRVHVGGAFASRRRRGPESRPRAPRARAGGQRRAAPRLPGGVRSRRRGDRGRGSGARRAARDGGSAAGYPPRARR